MGGNSARMLTKCGYVLWYMNDPLFLTVAQAALPVKVFCFTAWSESLRCSVLIFCATISLLFMKLFTLNFGICTSVDIKTFVCIVVILSFILCVGQW